MGIGLNVNSEPADFPADLREGVTSIFHCCGRQSDLELTARRLLTAIESLYSRAQTSGTRFILEEWQKRWAHKGLLLNRDGQTGIAEGLDTDGALLLRLPSGKLMRIHSGIVEPVEVPGS
jgi:BirA family biotin operon repressor/biotin-[acetyl-CoA-carboxylase] ligase